jgi:hypothetical protein
VTTSKPKNPGGRPALPPEQRRSEVIHIRLTPAQKEALDRHGGETWAWRAVVAALDKAARIESKQRQETSHSP